MPTFFKKSFCIAFLVIFFLLLSQLPALASNLYNLSDKVSRHAPLTPADHQIKFTTPSGVNEVGSYIRIGFDGGFNLSQILYSDLTLTHGPITGLETVETISATASPISWGFNNSANHLDLIHPTAAASGDIAPNEIIIIKIGTVNKIINPAVLGSKVIVLTIYDSANNVIDVGRLAVPVAIDQVGVGGVPVGTLPNPVTLNFPYNVTTSAMDLHWSENSDLTFQRYELYMGTSAGVTNLNGELLTNPLDPLFFNDRTHTTVNIDGLAPNRAYYFVVYVFDGFGNYAASNEVFATTRSSGTSWPDPPAQPTVNIRVCPIFLSSLNLDGTKSAGTTIFINGSNDGLNYPTDLTWSKLVSLSLGSNLFLIYSQDDYGQNSPILTATVNRCEIGDTNCNQVIDDFDLAGLAYHWATDWCYADFNADGIVDDFDLSGLAAHWDSIY